MSDLSTSGVVSLPSSYFEKAKLEYNNWVQAWFREALQNSLDAGSTKVKFDINQEGSDLIVSCKDNGKGMSSDILTNVFLSMGGSAKDEGNTGGFGYAKVLLAFAHKEYKIHTKDIRLSGSGGNYTYTEDGDTDGVYLEVNMGSGLSRQEFAQTLKEVVGSSKLADGTNVYLDDERIPSNTETLKYSMDTEIGKLQFEDSGDSYCSSVWVRMNGLSMFKVELWREGGSGAAFRGFLDLEGSSLEMLTSNRDSLSRTKNRILNRLFNQLSTNREALKLNKGLSRTINERLVDVSSFSQDSRAVFESNENTEMSFDEMISRINSGKITSSELRNMSDGNFVFESLIEEVILKKEKAEQELKKIPEKKYPHNFRIKNVSNDDAGSVSDKDIIANMQLIRNAKLAHGWDAIVKSILALKDVQSRMYIEEVVPGKRYLRSGMDINTGFVFGSAEGLNEVDRDGNSIYISINPVSVQEQELTVMDLADIAVHEIAHLSSMYHDEDFVMTDAAIRRIVRREIGENAMEKIYSGAIKSFRDRQKEIKHLSFEP